MPQRRAEVAVHVLMTDHLIRKTPSTIETGPVAERHGRQTGPVKLLYPPTLSTSAEDNLYVAIGTVRSSANVRADIPKLEAAIRAANPMAPEPYVVLADAWRTAGEPRRAVAVYRQALDHGAGQSQVYVALGELLLQVNRAAEAIRLLQAALGGGSRDVPMRNTLAVLYGSENRFSDAERLLEEAVQINPDEPLTWSNLGVARQALGQKERAEAAYREAVRLEPDFTRARQYLEGVSKN
jgi:Tfp pilus assembly protein PilF